MRPLALSNEQMRELRLAASSLPVHMRSGLLQLLAGTLQGRPNDAAFQQALSAALAALPACDHAPACACS
jgi:hypothetical protein